MEALLWAVPLSPAIGFAALAIFGRAFRGRSAGIFGSALMGFSFAASLVVAAGFLSRGGGAFTQSLGTWLDSGGLRVAWALRLDAISAVMMVVVTFVAFLIHLYSIESMAGEDGYARFFAYMNLFVANMLILSLADDLLLLFLGWEGVGLCSYLLIGFWYKEPANGAAAQKAFIVTRIGDAAMAIGLFLLFATLKTLEIPELLARAQAAWPPGSAVPTIACLLLLAGACGKSGQLPLQVWLPDAMAGPTPVSALIHAATMVTAGVYLVARLHLLFALAPAALFVTAVIGAATTVYGGLAALGQTDIKRILAYSTISQIGYMFLANGVGAWTAAIFHFATHAFFKALLFLSAGIVIDALHHEHDIFKMGGLRTRLPVAFWTFLIGAASLSSLPLVTAGFFSKDAIIAASWTSPIGGAGFFIASLVAALLTGLYAFRAVFIVFFGDPAAGRFLHLDKGPGRLMVLAVVILSFFAITAGYVGVPRALGGGDPIAAFLSGGGEFPGELGRERVAMIVSAVLALVGIAVAWVYARREVASLPARVPPGAAAVHPRGRLEAFLLSGLGFDRLYRNVFIRPYVFLTTANRRDVIDSIIGLISRAVALGHALLSATESGRVRRYATGLLLGAILTAAVLFYGRGR